MSYMQAPKIIFSLCIASRDIIRPGSIAGLDFYPAT